MLLEFTVSNFLSFKEKTTFSLVADPVEKNCMDNTFKLDTNTHDDISLLKTNLIFGQNGAGKSNLLKAVRAFKRVIMQSSKMDSQDSYSFITPFKLDFENLSKPSFFEMAFVSDNRKYKYTIEISNNSIYEEQLFLYATKRPTKIFKRSELDSDTRNTTPKNMLYLTKLDQNNNEHAQSVLKWFRHKLHIVFDNKSGSEFTLNNFESFSEKINSFLKTVDFGINQLETRELDEGTIVETINHIKDLFSEKNAQEISDSFSKRKPIRFVSKHKQIQANGLSVDVEFNFDKEESQGTQTLVAFLGPLFDIMQNEEVLFVDELTNGLHPNIVKALMKYILNQKDTKFQLIFTTHDTYLLDLKLFRREQIWFANKSSQNQSTEIYSLSDYKSKSQAKDSVEKKYLAGSYDAIPFINFAALNQTNEQ